MKKITFLLFIFISTFSFAQIVIGNGTNETQGTPFDPYFGHTYSQSIYPASSINATAGNITGLQWYYSGTTTGVLSTDLVIYIAHTSKSTFSSTTDWEPVGNLTQVYSGSISVTGTGYVTITFDTSFPYNGTDNLMIAVDENDPTFGVSADDFYNTAAPSNSSIVRKSDPTNIDPSSPGTGTLSGYVPNVILNGLVSSLPPNCTTLTQSTLINPIGNISWVPSSGASGYNLSIGSTSGASDILPVTDVLNVTTYSLSGLGLTNSTTYYVTLVPYNGAGPVIGCAVLPFTTRPVAVANDLCSGAIAITHETEVPNAAAATPTAGTVINAFDTNTPATVCNAFTGNANDDVWYSFVASASDVTITYELNFDGVATLYSGSCGSLVYVQCADLTVTTAPIVEEITVTGLTVGDTYYTRVYHYQSAQPANGNFNVKVWTPNMSTLGVDDVTADENSFTYFPNPVKNTLTLKAHNNIQNVSVYNMLGQEVLRTAPNTIENEVNMSSLQTGAYIVKVTINDNTKTIRVIKQ